MPIPKIKTAKIRNPFYELGDKITAMEAVASELKDAKLKELVRGMKSQRELLYKHIDANYIWD